MNKSEKVIMVTLVLSTFLLLSSGCKEDSPGIIKWSISTGRNNTSHFFEIVDDTIYVSYSTGHLYAIDKHTGILKWEYSDSDCGFSDCSVVDGVVYMWGWHKNPYQNLSENNYLYAVNSANGDLIWRFNLGGNGWNLLGIKIENKPIVSSGIVYIAGPDNYVFAIDIESHELQWRYSTGIKITNVESIASVLDGMVCFYTEEIFYVVDAATGELELQWTGESIEESWVRIRTAAVTDGVAYINAFFFENEKEKNYLYAIDIKNGDFKWKYETDWVDFPPIVVYGIIYFGSRDDYLYALDTDTGELLWEYKMSGNAMSSPMVNGETVYIGCNDHKLYAVDANSGKLLWRFKTGGPVYSSIIVEDNIIYFGSSDGYLYALEINESN